MTGAPSSSSRNPPCVEEATLACHAPAALELSPDEIRSQASLLYGQILATFSEAVFDEAAKVDQCNRLMILKREMERLCEKAWIYLDVAQLLGTYIEHGWERLQLCSDDVNHAPTQRSRGKNHGSRRR